MAAKDLHSENRHRHFAAAAGTAIGTALLSGVAAISMGIVATPAHAATPGPDCTIREVRISETRHFDPRHLGTLGEGAVTRPAATVRRQSVWKSRAPATGASHAPVPEENRPPEA